MISNISNTLKKSLYLRGFYCLIFTLFVFHVKGQNVNEHRTLKKARKYLAAEKYAESQEQYTKLLGAYPTNDLYNFEAGLSFYYASKDRKKSIPYFEAAVKHIKEDTVGEMFFYLAKSYQLVNDFEKSNETFKKFEPFIIKHSKHGQKVAATMTEEVRYNTNGIGLKNNPNKELKLNNLGDGVNTEEREYAPLWYKDGKVIIFTARRKGDNNKLDKFDLLPYEDIYIAIKNNDTWQLLDVNSDEGLKYLPKNINTKKHDAGIAYNADYTELYTYKQDAIWSSKFENGSWSPLSKVDKTVNTSESNIPSITISADGKNAFFVATKTEGFGLKDIYHSTREENGNWTKGELLPESINTEYDEDAPYLSFDGKTLYFSSTGHNSMGGYDVFKSELIDGEWSKAQNLGFPFNSPLDDIYFVADSLNENGFFASNRDEGFGAYDIYSFTFECTNIENSEIRGILYSSMLNKPLTGKLTLTDFMGKEVYSTNTDENGKFVLVAKPENHYELTIAPEGFEARTVKISLLKQCEFYPMFSDINVNVENTEDGKIQTTTVKNSLFDTKSEISTFKEKNNLPTLPSLAFLSPEEKEIMAFSETLEGTALNYKEINDTIQVGDAIGKPADQLMAFDDILFEFDRFNLTSKSKSTLNEVVKYLKSEEGKKYVITVAGHTDGKRDLAFSKKLFKAKKLVFTAEAAEKRSKEYNELLANKRAKATQKYLIRQGIDSERIIIKSFGEENPIAPNTNADGSDNPANRSLNRRVSFSLSNPKLL